MEEPKDDKLRAMLASVMKLLERCGPHLQGVEQECCGDYQADYGGEYMGMREIVPVCCGNGIDLSDHVANELRCIRETLELCRPLLVPLHPSLRKQTGEMRSGLIG